MPRRTLPVPRRAVVLAAGFGTRMRPLTRVVPKPLLPLWGVPVVERVLRMLHHWGIRHVLLNLHHGSDALLDFVRRRPPDGLRVDLSFEPDILGTGGVLRRASWFLDDRPFWMVNADLAADLEPHALIRALRTRDTAAALWLHPTRGPLTVEMQDGDITCFRSKRPGTEHTYTFCGIQLIRPAVVDLLPDGFSTIVEAYEGAMRRGRKIAGVVVPDAYWRDIGRPTDYLAAHDDLLRRQRGRMQGTRWWLSEDLRRGSPTQPAGVHVERFAALGEDVTVETGAHIERSVIWRGTRLGPHARVRNAVVASGVHLNGEAEHIVMRAGDVLAPPETTALEPLGWANARVAAECLPPRGSDRLFFRLHRGRRTAMLVRYDAAPRPENKLYAGHAGFLRTLGVRVPAVLHDAPRHAFTLFEDLGRVTLEQLMAAGLDEREQHRLYRRVLVMAHAMHAEGTHRARRRGLRMMPPFTTALYRWEREYFAEHFLSGLPGFTPARIGSILKELARAGRHLQRSDRALLHRDLQSANVIVQGRRVGLIDFQGMRYGAAAYDLGSLLCDPYATPSPGLRESMLRFYGGLSPRAERAVEFFPWAAVQRLAQALGAYGRLSALPGGEVYRGHIPRAIEMIRTVIAQLPSPLPALSQAMADAAALVAARNGNAD